MTWLRPGTLEVKKTHFGGEKDKELRGESFLCRVFSVKSVQNLRTFWRTTQNLLILALLCSLYSKQTFKVHFGVEKHIER